MYLLEYNNGVLDKITPDAPYGLIGIYVSGLSISIEKQLELGILEKVVEQDKIYYKIIGGNK